VSPIGNEALVEFQFDLHARYSTLAQVLQAALPGAGPRRVLDVGAGPAQLTAAFLPPDWAQIVRTDVSSFDDPSIVVVPPGAPLPFGDGAFDAVIAMDVLEHVAVAHRADFIRECARVARQVAVLATPIGTPSVADAELRYGRLYRDLAGRDEPFLVEHATLGLPRPEEVERAADGLMAVTLDNVRLVDWIATNVVDLAFALLDDGLQLKKQIAQRFNETTPPRYCDSEHYRRFYLFTRDPQVEVRLRELADPAALPSAQGQGEDPLTVAVLAFREYARRWHGPTLESVIADRERKASDLGDQLRLTERHIADLDQAVARLRDAIASKERHIEGLTGQYEALARLLDETVAAKDRHIEGLTRQHDEHVRQLAETVAAKDAYVACLLRALHRAGIVPPVEPSGR
jgi:SAM-dependent methyltransferase